jgi:hypothetical protein
MGKYSSELVEMAKWAVVDALRKGPQNLMGILLAAEKNWPRGTMPTYIALNELERIGAVKRIEGHTLSMYFLQQVIV